MNYQIEPLQTEDWPQVRSIYAESISTGVSTRLPSCRFVARNGKYIYGWVSFSPSSSTWGYVGAADVSVHVGKAGQRQGIGTALLKALFAASENEKYWTLTAEIIFENSASLALHKKCGFRKIGYRVKLGHVQGVWHDVILLERRSQKTGGNGLPTRKCK